MDRLTEMASFVAVVEGGSFAAAAVELGVSAQIVGRRIGQLEDRLGGPLLVRNTRRNRLTEAGQLFYDQCRGIMAAVRAAETSAAEAAGGSPRGQMVISAPRAFGSLMLADVLARYLHDNPRVSVRLDLTDRFVDLIGEQVDLALRIGALGDSGLIARRLRDYRLQPFAAPGYLQRYGEPASPDDLARHECILLAYENGGLFDRWTFERDGDTESIRVTGRFVTEDGRIMAELAAAGHGILLQDERLIDDHIASGRLVRILAQYDGPLRRLNLLYGHPSPLPPALRSLADTLLLHFETASTAVPR